MEVGKLLTCKVERVLTDQQLCEWGQFGSTRPRDPVIEPVRHGIHHSTNDKLAQEAEMQRISQYE